MANILLFLGAVVSAANSEGNCVSGKMPFIKERVYVGAPPIGGVNPSKYDFIIDYGFTEGPDINVEFTSTGVDLHLVRDPKGGVATGARISTTRTFKYAKLAAKFSAIDTAGAITTFITMSDVKDELDVEIVGNDKNNFQSNVFYRGIEERGVHGGTHPVSGVGSAHEYIIDWKPSQVDWSVDGKQSRTYKNDENAKSPRTPAGERWYPNTASKVQISVWDFGGGVWGGGPIPWGSKNRLSASYEYIEVSCYNENGIPVPRWPLDATDISFNETVTSTTVAPTPRQTYAASAASAAYPMVRHVVVLITGLVFAIGY